MQDGKTPQARAYSADTCERDQRVTPSFDPTLSLPDRQMAGRLAARYGGTRPMAVPLEPFPPLDAVLEELSCILAVALSLVAAVNAALLWHP